MIIGLTGGSGSGKTTVAKLLRDRGFFHIDSDAVVHNDVYPSPRFISAIRSAFGDGYIVNGAVDRPALSRLVFSDRAAYDKLMKIIVPLVLERIDALLEAHSGENVVLDAPLLFQYDLDKKCGATVGVISKNALSRIRERDGISEKAAAARLASQPEPDFYLSRCDRVIKNDGSLSDLERETDAVLNSIIISGRK